MAETFKCPICGCTEHYQLRTIYDASDYDENQPRALMTFVYKPDADNWSRLSLNSHFCAYLCQKCGHVELFAKGMVDEINDQKNVLNKKIEETQLSIKELKAKKDTMKEEKAILQKRSKELSSLLKSEDITIRQQKQYSEEAKKISNAIDKIYRDSSSIDKEVDAKLQDLEKMKLLLERVVEFPVKDLDNLFK